MTAPSSFVLQPNLIWLAVSPSNYLLYDFNDTRFQKIKKKILDIFVLLVTFEILSQYPIIDSSHWLKEDVQWITDKIFMKNL